MKIESGELTQRLEVILSVIETDRTKFHEKIASAINKVWEETRFNTVSISKTFSNAPR